MKLFVLGLPKSRPIAPDRMARDNRRVISIVFMC